MFTIDDDLTIKVTRGDSIAFSLSAEQDDTGFPHTFYSGDVLRIKVFRRKDCEQILLQKDFTVEDEALSVDLFIDGDEIKFGEIINKPVDYWYEVELNPDTEPQTIVGYDDDGPKIFRLYPEGKDL